MRITAIQTVCPSTVTVNEPFTFAVKLLTESDPVEIHRLQGAAVELKRWAAYPDVNVGARTGRGARAVNGSPRER